MELSYRQIGPSLVVSFSGRVDLEGEASAKFKQRLKALIAEGHASVVVDLENVAFLDSDGLAALISALKCQRETSGSLSLANVSEAVEAVLRITRLARVFDVHPSVDAAVAAVGRRHPAAAKGS